ncbi:MAG: SufS family cysteine desulfurase [Bacteroidota bacterium]
MITKDLNIEEIRARFPALNQEVNGKPLVYFDNAASSQTVKESINSLMDFYEKDHANIHRGIHTLAERSTKKYEASRQKVAEFIHAKEAAEIVFTKGTTESINLVAQSWGQENLVDGDEILLSQLEHHSNIVPWQLVANRTGAIIRVIPINKAGEIDLNAFEKMLSPKVKLVSVNYISNALGTVNPVHEIIRLAKKLESTIFIDAAQAAPHLKIDVQHLDCDFLGFSSHKVFGPTGVGILYGKRSLLEKMSPYQGGGEMIKDVSFEKTTYNEIPYKFEAGTPNIGEVIALKPALDFIEELGHEAIQKQEGLLLARANQLLSEIQDFQPFGTAKNKASLISFLIDGIHPYDIGQMLDAKGIAVRTGHHCTQPLMDFYGIEGTVRASFAVYNTIQEVEYFVDSLRDLIRKLK